MTREQRYKYEMFVRVRLRRSYPLQTKAIMTDVHLISTCPEQLRSEDM